MKGKYIILGAGGHAKVVLDILELNQEEIYGLTDAEFRYGDTCMGYCVLGTDDILAELYQQGIKNAAMGIGHVGNPLIRNKVYCGAKKIGYTFPNVIHLSAVVARTCRMGEGNLLAAQCVLNPEAEIGNLCIVNTGAVIEHECRIGDGVHLAPNATVLGAATVGSNSFIGAGSVILQGIHIGQNCIIGAGCVVISDVDDNSVVVGNPGRLVKRR